MMEQNRTSKKNIELYILIVYAVVLIVLNFIRIFDNNFWGDEGYSIKLAQMSISEMCSSTAADVHPPLYYLILILAYRIFGNHGWLYHLVSLIPFLVVVVFTLTVIRRRFQTEAAFIFLTLIGLSSNAVTYNVEVRMYSLTFALLFFAYYGFYKIIKGEKYGCVMFVLCSIGAAYSHYYAIFSLIFIYFSLIYLVVTKKLSIKKLVAMYAVTVIGYLPWLFQLMSTFKRTADDFWIVSYPGAIESFYSLFYSDQLWYSGLMANLTLCVVLYSGYRHYKLKKKADGSIDEVTKKDSIIDCDDLVWLVCGLISSLGTIGIGLLISALIRPALMIRYLYPVSAIFWLVLSVAIGKLRQKKVVAVIVVIVSLCAYIPMYITMYNKEKKDNSNCISTQERLEEVLEPGDFIYTDIDHLGWTVLDYYFPKQINVDISYGYPKLDKEHHYWLAWEHELGDDVKEWLDDNGCTAELLFGDGFLGRYAFLVYRVIFVQ